MRLSLLLLALLVAGCDGLFDTVTTVSGVVIDATTGQPVADMNVAITAAPKQMWIPTLAASTLTDADGRYRLRTTETNGTLEISANHPLAPGYKEGYWLSTSATLETGDANNVTLSIRRMDATP